MCKLSIVTVTFNDLLGLQATAASLRGLDLDFEWIVVDGGTDEFNAASFTEGLPVAAVISEKDNGIYDAMNKGLAVAAGDYVLFLNSGDQISSSLDFSVAVNSISDEDVVYCGVTFCSGSRKVLYREPRNPLRYVFYSVPGNQQGTFYKREFLIQIGGVPIEYKLSGDYALAALLYKNHAVAKALDVNVTNFYLGGQSTYKIYDVCLDMWNVQRRILMMTTPRCLYYLARRCLTMLVARIIHEFFSRSCR